MYEVLNNVLYHIEGFTDFCFARPVSAILFLTLQLTIIAFVIEIIGLDYQKRQNSE